MPNPASTRPGGRQAPESRSARPAGQAAARRVPALLAAALAAVLLVACDSGSTEPAPTTGPATSQELTAWQRKFEGTSCAQFTEPAGDEHQGGPLQDAGSRVLGVGMRTQPGDPLQQVAVIPVTNQGAEPVAVLSVEFVTEKGASPLTVAGVRLAPADIRKAITRPTSRFDRWPDASDYCLPGTDGGTGTDLTPTSDPARVILAFRIGPAPDEEVNGAKESKNNAINLHYATSDGGRYVAVYPYQFYWDN
ncbi:hypothetical protein [Nocardioides sp. GY 10127]|uniref:hypothetical protein n=1 Tax=Nocardioides sp. GY 10127 TaxID=2569762 RepID=UPI0010A78C44|nr:hypothetical protein [Nocardioides sp. GY 10127]TIC85535.1 hypothetical protein E8D37_02575 [Nocardioides sp. GY 10127]